MYLTTFHEMDTPVQNSGLAAPPLPRCLLIIQSFRPSDSLKATQLNERSMADDAAGVA